MASQYGKVSAREAARRRMPLDGADAQAMEGALTLTERERDEAIARAEAAEAGAAGLRKRLDDVLGACWKMEGYAKGFPVCMDTIIRGYQRIRACARARGFGDDASKGALAGEKGAMVTIDIVERLRQRMNEDEVRHGFWDPLFSDAANEISTLRSENAKLREERERVDDESPLECFACGSEDVDNIGDNETAECMSCGMSWRPERHRCKFCHRLFWATKKGFEQNPFCKACLPARLTLAQSRLDRALAGEKGGA